MKKTVILTLAAMFLGFALLIGCGGKAPAEKPTDEQIKAFRSVKTVKIKVDQSYSGNIKAKLPFEAVAASVLQSAGLKPAGGGATLVIRAKGASENQKSVLKGSFTFKMPGAPNFTRTFEAATKKPHLTKYYARVGVTFYDTDVIYQPDSFSEKLLRTIHEAYGPEAVANALRSKEKDVRRNAAFILGEYKQAAGVDALISAFHDEDAMVKSAAVEALAKIGQPAMASLQAALSDKDMVVRRHAMTALAMIADPNAIGPWIEALRDEDPKVQQTATFTLVKAGADAVEPLLAALSDRDKYFRRSVIFTLGELKDPRAIPALVAGLGDREPATQKAAAVALGKIGQPAIDPLIGALNDKNPGVRISAAGALGELKDPKALNALTGALKDKDRLVRVAAVLALTGIGDKQAIKPLTDAMNQKNLQIKDEAAKAIEALNKGRGKP